jgi:hypothetical protein
VHKTGVVVVKPATQIKKKKKSNSNEEASANLTDS